MNILITAGGTSEYIDSVRKITNSSSGKLGATIAQTLLKRKDIDNIYYIHTPKAIKPEGDKITYVEVVNTQDVKEAVQSVLKTHRVDWLIHSMAISDYYVDYVSNAKIVAEDLKNEDDFEYALKNPKNKLDNTNKLSSYEDNLIVVLKQTPKIISLIKKLSPNTKLIGFKLLTDTTEENLIDVGYNLLQKNDCDYVVANDLKNISKDTHIAFIIDKAKNIIKTKNKEDIAKKINKLISKSKQL